MNTWAVIGFVCVCVLLETLAEIVLNKWAKPGSTNGGKAWMMAVGITFYIGIAVVYGFGLKYGSVTIANAWWQCLSLVTITLVGVYMFHNKPTIGQWCGVCVLFAGTLLLLAGSPEFKRTSSDTIWFKKWSPI